MPPSRVRARRSPRAPVRAAPRVPRRRRWWPCAASRVVARRLRLPLRVASTAPARRHPTRAAAERGARSACVCAARAARAPQRAAPHPSSASTLETIARGDGVGSWWPRVRPPPRTARRSGGGRDCTPASGAAWCGGGTATPLAPAPPPRAARGERGSSGGTRRARRRARRARPPHRPSPPLPPRRDAHTRASRRRQRRGAHAHCGGCMRRGGVVRRAAARGGRGARAGIGGTCIERSRTDQH